MQLLGAECLPLLGLLMLLLSGGYAAGERSAKQVLQAIGKSGFGDPDQVGGPCCKGVLGSWRYSKILLAHALPVQYSFARAGMELRARAWMCVSACCCCSACVRVCVGQRACTSTCVHYASSRLCTILTQAAMYNSDTNLASPCPPIPHGSPQNICERQLTLNGKPTGTRGRGCGRGRRRRP